jgi:hypothetical protein
MSGIKIAHFNPRTGATVRTTALQRVSGSALRPMRLRALGALPSRQDWRPATAEDRDALVEFLAGLDYSKEETGDWRVMTTVDTAEAGKLPTILRWTIRGESRRDAERMAQIEGEETAMRLGLAGPVRSHVHPAGEPKDDS